MQIFVVYSPSNDITSSSNKYSIRAASGPVTVNCTATGPGNGMVSYQWSSTCRDCPFQSSKSESTSRLIRRAAVHSGDNGTHTCVATKNEMNATASIDFLVVGK